MIKAIQDYFNRNDRDRWDRDDELQAWRDVGQRLWPYVRYFGLCGADTEATQAVADLALCLGLDEGREIAKSAQQAAQAPGGVAKQCAQWLMDHRFYGRKVRKSDMERLAREMMEHFEGGREIE